MRHLWLVRPANDTRQEAAIAALAVEERARAMVVAYVVTPEGVRVVWGGGEPASSGLEVRAVG